MNVGSLFAGIGGFDLGLERAGMRTAWFCEADDFCRRVLAKHWPDIPCYPDVCTLRGADVEPVDVLCGGFPCQDISSAGRGAGLAGARSGLWSEFARLISELRPRYAIVENVPMLRTRGLDQVLEDLTACGYDAEWDGISASAVGAPHRRDRIWIVAYPSSVQRAALVRDEPDGDDPCTQGLAHSDRERHEPDGAARGVGGATRAREGEGPERERLRDAAHGGSENVADADDAGRIEQRRPGAGAAALTTAELAGWWSVEPGVGRVAHGVPTRVDRLRSLGNALVPQIAEWIGHRILEYEASAVTTEVVACA